MLFHTLPGCFTGEGPSIFQGDSSMDPFEHKEVKVDYTKKWVVHYKNNIDRFRFWL